MFRGHTGTWKGVPVTVMASGMGIPAISIYSWELFNFYDVDNIIRIGSAGALSDDLKLMDIIAGQGPALTPTTASSSTSAAPSPHRGLTLLSTAVEAARDHGVDMKVGNLLSSDDFYSADGWNRNDAWKRMGVLGVEMEAAGLYMNAAYAGKRALCICTVSDHLYRPEALSPEDRQESLTQMIEIALDTAAKMASK